MFTWLAELKVVYQRKKEKGHWGQKTNSEACSGQAKWNKQIGFLQTEKKEKKKSWSTMCPISKTDMEGKSASFLSLLES